MKAKRIAAEARRLLEDEAPTVELSLAGFATVVREGCPVKQERTG